MIDQRREEINEERMNVNVIIRFHLQKLFNYRKVPHLF